MISKRMSILVSAGLTAAVAGAFTVSGALSFDKDPEPSLTSIVHSAQSIAPDDQQAAPADGVVTRDELSAAFARVAECTEQRGLHVDILADGDDPQVTFAAASVEEGQSRAAILASCESVHLSEVQRVFNAARRPTEAQRASGRVFFGDCMRGFGVPVAQDDPGEAQLLTWAQSEDPPVSSADAVCTARHHAELGFWP